MTQEKMRVRLIDERRTLKSLLLGGVGTLEKNSGVKLVFSGRKAVLDRIALLSNLRQT